jgi:hypothetical protein
MACPIGVGMRVPASRNISKVNIISMASTTVGKGMP